MSRVDIVLDIENINQSLILYSKDAPTNPRGIPYAPFVDKVEDYVSSRAEVDGTMKSFQEMISYLFAPRRISLLRLNISGNQKIPIYGSQHTKAEGRPR